MAIKMRKGNICAAKLLPGLHTANYHAYYGGPDSAVSTQFRPAEKLVIIIIQLRRAGATTGA